MLEEDRRSRDAVLSDRLLPLLRGPRAEHACAAAVVLGVLRPRDPRVGRTLARRLRTARTPVRPYLREALARQGTEAALEILAHGLLASGVEREQSRRLLAGFGARALPWLDRVLEAHPDESGAPFFEIAACLKSRAGVAWLVAHLCAAPARRARALGRALSRDRIERWPRDLRRLLRARVLRAIRAGRFGSAAGVRVAFELLALV